MRIYAIYVIVDGARSDEVSPMGRSRFLIAAGERLLFSGTAHNHICGMPRMYKSIVEVIEMKKGFVVEGKAW